MYVGYGAVTTLAVAPPGGTTTLMNPLAIVATAGSVAEAWATSLAASFKVRVEKAGKDVWGPLAIAFDQCQANPQASDPSQLFDIACLAPEPLSQYVGTAAMAEITNGNSKLHQDMRSFLASVAGQYGAAATQGMVGTFAKLAAPLLAGIGKTKTDIISGDAAVAWNNDLKVLASVAAPQTTPSVMTQKVVSVAPRTVISGGGVSTTTPAPVTQVAPHGDVKKPAQQGGAAQAWPTCPPGTFATGPLPEGTCLQMPTSQLVAPVEATPPPTQSTLQKALPWVAGMAAVGAVLWFATRNN